MRRGTGRKNLITMKKKLTLDGHQSCQRENERHVLQADWKHWATRKNPVFAMLRAHSIAETHGTVGGRPLWFGLPCILAVLRVHMDIHYGF